jgi:hypothetical protein
MNLLSVANDKRFSEHVVNWDECVAVLAGVFKGRPRDPHSVDAPDPYFDAVLREIAHGDPRYLQRLLQVFAATPPSEPKCRWTYPVVWRDDEFGEMRFVAVVNTASEPDSLAFNDWIPIDAESWAVLEQVKARK